MSSRACDPLTRIRRDPFSAASRFDNDNGTITTNDAITAWGYMPEREHFNLGSVGITVPLAALVSSAGSSHDRLKENVATACAVLPSRALTGSTFLYYLIIDGISDTDRYSDPKFRPQCELLSLRCLSASVSDRLHGLVAQKVRSPHAVPRIHMPAPQNLCLFCQVPRRCITSSDRV